MKIQGAKGGMLYHRKGRQNPPASTAYIQAVGHKRKAVIPKIKPPKKGKKK